VIVGVGLTGTILAKELAEAGLKVVGLERGRWRDTDPTSACRAHDELRFVKRHELMQTSRARRSPSASTRTRPRCRCASSARSARARCGRRRVHWGGHLALPPDFETRSRTLARYGKNHLAEECTSQDWGVTYDELEPHFDRFEYLYGISGKAGNIKGKIIPGGNPFEGPRSRDYATPPLKTSYAGSLFKQAVEKMGFKPFPTPSGALSQPYTNEYGATINACVYCGYCQFFGCEMGAKASPQTAVLPNLMKQKNFELRTHANVTKVNLDSAKKRAVGVTYVDSRGREFEQPADIVLLCSYVLNNTRLMLMSGIGKPYDPVANTGVVGRNYAYQTPSSVTLFFEDKVFNQFMAAGGLAMTNDEFNGDNFDHPAWASSAAAACRRRPPARGRSRCARCRAARRAGAPNGRQQWRSTSTARSGSRSRAPARATAATTSTSIRPTATSGACRSCA
jgi:gluconate 2-dehydrogenase alpha chain